MEDDEKKELEEMAESVANEFLNGGHMERIAAKNKHLRDNLAQYLGEKVASLKQDLQVFEALARDYETHDPNSPLLNLYVEADMDVSATTCLLRIYTNLQALEENLPESSKKAKVALDSLTEIFMDIKNCDYIREEQSKWRAPRQLPEP